MKNQRRIVSLFLLAAILITAGACSAAAPSSAQMEYMDNMAPQASVAPAAAAPELSATASMSGGANSSYSRTTEEGVYEPSGASVPEANRKLIRRADVQIETTSFETSLQNLEVMVAEYGGYVESSVVDGNRDKAMSGQPRFAGYTVRVPQDKFSAFLTASGNLGNVTNRSSSTQDVTEQYVDTEARLTSLRIKEERLLEMLRKTEKLEDIVNLESTLADTRYQIESLTGSLRKLDGLVSYSTISLELREVLEYTEPEPVNIPPKTLGERIGANFSRTLSNVSDGFADFLVWFIGGLPALVVWLIILGIPTFIFVKLLRRTLGKNPPKPKRGKSAPPPEPPEDSSLSN